MLEEIGAGDQGHMFGYATDETDQLMPLTHVLATQLGYRLTQVRISNKILHFLSIDVATAKYPKLSESLIRRWPLTHNGFYLLSQRIALCPKIYMGCRQAVNLNEFGVSSIGLLSNLLALRA